jgi:hypothetical protein
MLRVALITAILALAACSASDPATQSVPPLSVATSLAPAGTVRSVASVAAQSSGESAYPNGTPAAVPGIVAFDNYDLGGAEVAYHTAARVNPGGAYRHDGVGIQATTDTAYGNGFNVGWDENGNWYRYTVAVTANGTYAVAVRIASVTPAGGALASFHIADEAGTNLTGPVTVPVTGGFQKWKTIVTSATLTSGTHVLTVFIDAGHASFNLNTMTFAPSQPGPSPSPTTQPTATAAPTGIPTVAPSTMPVDFWDRTNIPPAKNVMTFKFLNRTNGKFSDRQVFWSVTIGNVKQTHSIAEQPTFDMPANASGRVYVYLGTPGTTSTSYYDFMEYTIGATQFNGNTTRVDAFGIKLAMLLHCADGYDVSVGEDAATFAEDRATTFARFIAAVPVPFKALAMQQAPYRIVNPGAGGFGVGGPYASYYSAYVDEVWSSNGLTISKPGPNGSGLAAYPNLSAALYRHTAGPGTFAPNGKLLSQAMWANPSTFYTAAPADYYAKFWHDNAIGGKAYGFPYDDVGGYSSYISHSGPQYLLIAVGW